MMITKKIHAAYVKKLNGGKFEILALELSS